MTETSFPSRSYSDDVAVIRRAEQTVLLVGTAHISRESADLVEEIIEQEQPDLVCIELDEKRCKALSEPQQWRNLDLKQVIKNKQLATLLVNLVLSSYQKKLGGKLGVQPGTELLTAAKAAEKHGIAVQLCDRDVRVTLRRAWKATSLFKKGYLLASLFASLFDQTELTEEKLAELRHQDVLSELMDEIGKALPAAKAALTQLMRVAALEWGKDGIRIVIELSKDAVPEVVQNNLYKLTQMRTTFGIILLAVVNNQPKVFNLKELLQHFVGDDRMVQFEHATMLRPRLQDVTCRAEILGQAHDDLFAQGINRRVSDLGEKLLEIPVEELVVL